MKAMPKIEKFMTTIPQMIGNEIPIKTAILMMQTNHIRHLPVQTAGKLTGILSDHDIQVALSFGDAETLSVGDVMTQNPYRVEPQTPLDQVVLNMAEHKYGCAVVQQENGKVVGIFTANDGLRVLGEILDQNYKVTANCCS